MRSLLESAITITVQDYHCWQYLLTWRIIYKHAYMQTCTIYKRGLDGHGELQKSRCMQHLGPSVSLAIQLSWAQVVGIGAENTLLWERHGRRSEFAFHSLGLSRYWESNDWFHSFCIAHGQRSPLQSELWCLSSLCIPACYTPGYLWPMMTRVGPSLRHRYFSISVSSILLTNTSKRSLSCCCIFS